MPSTFTLVTACPAPAAELFDRSLSIDAHLQSMQHTRERVIAGVNAGQIGLGQSVTWRARHLGVWFTMTSAITQLERPVRFVDEQTRGPFACFVHEHRFTPTATSSVMTDRITVGSPLFGAVAERLILVPYPRRLIARRNRALIEVADEPGKLTPRLR